MAELTPDAAAENKACEAVVAEFRAMLAQNGTPDAILKLCEELEGRIMLRRTLRSFGKPTS